METTLGEDLMLLALDDETGKQSATYDLPTVLAAAVLVELALAGRVDVRDKRVHVTDPTPTGHRAQDKALADLGDARKPRTASDWLPRLQKHTADDARAGLLEKGLIREEKKKVLGVFTTTRHPEADGSVEAALRERLAAAVLRGEGGDERTVALVALLHGAGLHALAFPDEDRKRVKAAMAEVAEGQWASPAVRKAIETSQAIVTMVATTAALSATTTTATTT